MNYSLIKSGGGTGPMKPGNHQFLNWKVPNPTRYLFALKDERKAIQ